MGTKHQNIKTSIKIILSTVILVATTPALSFDLNNTLSHGHAVIQLGNFWSHQGQPQHININGLIGDDFTVTKAQGNNGLVGLGYFIDGQDKNLFKMSYGINAFYLAKTAVNGNVVQEGLFTNLSYGYHVTHFPVYAAAKATIDTKSFRYAWTLVAGIGPNFSSTSAFQEQSLDNITIPDRIFSGRTTTAFSATAGLGLKLNNVFGKQPLECGYRFFYLGQSHFNKESNQLLNTLSTGNNYANALMCSVTV